jgi:hypothetical protein
MHIDKACGGHERAIRFAVFRALGDVKRVPEYCVVRNRERCVDIGNRAVVFDSRPGREQAQVCMGNSGQGGED